MNSSLHMEQVFEAFDQWERTQRCIRGHVRIVREDVERIVEQLEALRGRVDATDKLIELQIAMHEIDDEAVVIRLLESIRDCLGSIPAKSPS